MVEMRDMECQLQFGREGAEGVKQREGIGPAGDADDERIRLLDEVMRGDGGAEFV